jgi:hypothetical protein
MNDTIKRALAYLRGRDGTPVPMPYELIAAADQIEAALKLNTTLERIAAAVERLAPVATSRMEFRDQSTRWGDAGPIPGQQFGDEFDPHPPTEPAIHAGYRYGETVTDASPAACPFEHGSVEWRQWMTGLDLQRAGWTRPVAANHIDDDLRRLATMNTQAVLAGWDFANNNPASDSSSDGNPYERGTVERRQFEAGFVLCNSGMARPIRLDNEPAPSWERAPIDDQAAIRAAVEGLNRDHPTEARLIWKMLTGSDRL